jgi:hypothetical protein
MLHGVVRGLTLEATVKSKDFSIEPGGVVEVSVAPD